MPKTNQSNINPACQDRAHRVQAFVGKAFGIGGDDAKGYLEGSGAPKDLKKDIARVIGDRPSVAPFFNLGFGVWSCVSLAGYLAVTSVASCSNKGYCSIIISASDRPSHKKQSCQQTHYTTSHPTNY